MANVLPSTVLLAVGADVLTRYGTLVKRSAPPARGGEIPYTFARTGNGLYGASDGNVYTAAGGIARLEWVVDPVTAVLQPYLLLEAAATNVALRSRDLSNAAWTKTTMTATLDQVGIDGTVNAASSLLATAGNATCLQAITLASSTRFQTAYVKRLVGSGVVQMTTDGGGTWTTIPITTAWTRYSIPAQLVTNPSVGFRLVTNTDKVAVDFVQNEGGVSPLGTFQTSVIPTTTVAVTRNADSCSVPWYVGMQPLWIYRRFLERGTVLFTSGAPGGTSLGTSPPQFYIVPDASGKYRATHAEAAGTVSSILSVSPSVGNVVELLALLFPDGSVELHQSINGAAETVAARSAPLTLSTGPMGGVAAMILNGTGAGVGYEALSRQLVGLGPGTLVSTIPDARSIPV